MVQNKLRKIIFAVFAGTVSLTVQAEQLFQAKTGQTITATISAIDLTRVQVSGFPITKAYTTADITVKKDTTNGQVYIVPNPEQSTKGFTLYIVDSNGDTFNLNLTPSKNARGDSIVILPDLASIRRAKLANTTNLDTTNNTPYSRSINELIQNMYLGNSEDNMQGIAVNQVNVEIPMWQGMRVIQALSYENQTLVGKVLIVTNNTSGKVELRESEFFNKGVLAIAIENPILNVGDTTRVFVVYENASGK